MGRVTIRSKSEEGTYYLCNHWNKNKSFWIKKNDITEDKLFKSQKEAKCSLTKLVKVMPEYEGDEFYLVKFKDDWSERVLGYIKIVDGKAKGEVWKNHRVYYV